MKDAKDFIEYLRSGDWIDKLSGQEHSLLADFLKTSMAKQRRKIAFAERVKDGVIYVVYKIKSKKTNDSLDLLIPGEIIIHKDGEPLPKEIASIPRIAFTTLFCLGEIVENQ